MFGCDDETSVGIAIFIINCIILDITIIVIFYQFIKRFNNLPTPEKQSKSLFIYIGIPFLIISIIALPLQIPYVILRECESKLNNMYGILVLAANSSQFYIMQIIWFMRLYYGFKTSILRISKCTIYCYIIAFVLFTMIAIPSVLGTLFMEYSKWTAVIGLFSFFSISMSISFSVIFINKLIRAYKELSDDDKFISIINRITILTIISVIMTTISTITTITRVNYPQSTVLRFLSFFTVTFDIYTNCLSIILSYSSFTDLYNILLGWLDLRCKAFWIKLYGSQNAEKGLVEISVTSVSGTNTNTNTNVETVTETSRNVPL